MVLLWRKLPIAGRLPRVRQTQACARVRQRFAARSHVVSTMSNYFALLSMVLKSIKIYSLLGDAGFPVDAQPLENNQTKLFFIGELPPVSLMCQRARGRPRSYVVLPPKESHLLSQGGGFVVGRGLGSLSL